MNIKLRDLVRDAATLLQDPDGVRWPAEELLRYAHNAYRRYVVLRPDNGAQRVTIKLTEGHQQRLPDEFYLLSDITNNATPPYTPIRKARRDTLDVVVPRWRAAPPAREAIHFCIDPVESRDFDVYPPVMDGTMVTAVVVADHAPLPQPTGPSYTSIPADAELNVPSVFHPAFVSALLSQAWDKDAEFASNTALVAKYDAAFLAELTRQFEAKTAVQQASSGTA